MKSYQGSCHCESVRFEVDADIDHVRMCDCSACHKWGSETAEDCLCPKCGILPFRRPSVPTETELKTGSKKFFGWAVNTRCLDRFVSNAVAIDKIVRAEIDAVNDLIYETVNDGVYRTGFANSQAAYEHSVAQIFGTLDQLEERLNGQHHLCGTQVTEADWRLFATLIRFDLVYYSLFKCSHKHICEYPNLWNYTLELYQVPGVSGIIPIKSEIVDYTAPHNRGDFAKSDAMH